MTWLDVRCRACVPEIMDGELADAQHAHALRGLSRLNAVSRSSQILWRPIARLIPRKKQPLRVLDLACGGGEVALGLWQKAAQKKIRLDILGTDISPHAVEFARRRAARRRIPVEFRVCDVLNDHLPSGFDVVVSSLFFHHLTDERAAALLQRMASAARHLVLVNDLYRSPAALVLVAAASRLVTTSPVVHVDAVRSARAGFTTDELRAIAEAARLRQAEVARRHPCRLLLSWHRP